MGLGEKGRGAEGGGCGIGLHVASSFDQRRDQRQRLVCVGRKKSKRCLGFVACGKFNHIYKARCRR